MKYRQIFTALLCMICCSTGGLLSAAEPAAVSEAPAPVSAESAYSVRKGLVCIDANATLGTYGLSIIDPETEKRVTILSARDAYSTSFFALKIGRTVYRLNRYYGVPSSIQKKDAGMQIIYTVANAAEVTADFDILRSSDVVTLPENMIKVTLTVKNTGRTLKVFALRALFDTVLGEMGQTDFSTAGRPAIDSELQFSSMQIDRWVTTRDSKYAAQFLLHGRDITDPELVTMANRDVLNSAEWMMNYIPGRAFNSILSYNNSALDVDWSKFDLYPGKSQSVIFYIVLAAQGSNPDGEDFLDSGGTAAAEPVPVPAPVQAQTPVQKDVPFEVAKIKKEQLDPEYVRNLIQEINNLESDGSSTNKEKIKQLNAELDAILFILKKK